MFDQLKPLLQNGERYIVVEDGRPAYVLMRFPDYVALVRRKGGNPGHNTPSEIRPGELARANVELETVGIQEPELSAGFAVERGGAPAVDPTTIRLEDLPL